MARIRTIKPEILEDEKTSALSDAAYRLFTSMIFLADDHGNVRADARWLQAQIWWAHREPPRVAEILREVSGAGLVTLYEVRGGIYAHLNGWEKHQRIDNAGKPRVPVPNDPDAKEVSTNHSDPRGNSPRDSANRGETPLDPDLGPPTTDLGPLDREAAANSPLPPKTKGPKAAKVRRDQPMPETWAPTDAHRELAQQVGADCGREAESFRDYHASKGNQFADWNAAFRNWLRNTQRFTASRTATDAGSARRGDLRAGDLLEQQLRRVAEAEAAERGVP